MDGDLVVVMNREGDGSVSEEVIQTKNVTYIVPTKVYKEYKEFTKIVITFKEFTKIVISLLWELRVSNHCLVGTM